MANALYLLSGRNISAKKIWEDQTKSLLLKWHKSGDFSESSSSKPNGKAAHCQEKRLNLTYFGIQISIGIVSQQK